MQNKLNKYSHDVPFIFLAGDWYIGFSLLEEMVILEQLMPCFSSTSKPTSPPHTYTAMKMYLLLPEFLY